MGLQLQLLVGWFLVIFSVLYLGDLKVDQEIEAFVFEGVEFLLLELSLDVRICRNVVYVHVTRAKIKLIIHLQVWLQGPLLSRTSAVPFLKKQQKNRGTKNPHVSFVWNHIFVESRL